MVKQFGTHSLCWCHTRQKEGNRWRHRAVSKRCSLLVHIAQTSTFDSHHLILVWTHVSHSLCTRSLHSWVNPRFQVVSTMKSPLSLSFTVCLAFSPCSLIKSVSELVTLLDKKKQRWVRQDHLSFCKALQRVLGFPSLVFTTEKLFFHLSMCAGSPDLLEPACKLRNVLST